MSKYIVKNCPSCREVWFRGKKATIHFCGSCNPYALEHFKIAPATAPAPIKCSEWEDCIIKQLYKKAVKQRNASIIGLFKIEVGDLNR